MNQFGVLLGLAHKNQNHEGNGASLISQIVKDEVAKVWSEAQQMQEDIHNSIVLITRMLTDINALLMEMRGSKLDKMFDIFESLPRRKHVS